MNATNLVSRVLVRCRHAADRSTAAELCQRGAIAKRLARAFSAATSLLRASTGRVSVGFVVTVMTGVPVTANAAFPVDIGYWAQSFVTAGVEFSVPDNPYRTADAACQRTVEQGRITHSQLSLSKIILGTEAAPICRIEYTQNGGVFAHQYPIRVSASECPANSSRTGSTCTCIAPFLEDAKRNGCYMEDAVRNDRVFKSAGATCVGNPIYPLTGSKKEVVDTGWSVGGQPLRLTYDSGRHLAATTSGVAANGYGEAASFDGLWLSSLHRGLKVSPAGFGVQRFRGDGTATSFSFQGNAYVADGDVAGQLTAISGGYRYVDAIDKSVETYTSSGRLTSWSDVFGNSLSFTYSSTTTGTAPAAGYLLRVKDNRGRSISFEYVTPFPGVLMGNGRVSRIVNSVGQAITTAYSANGNLTALTWEDGKTRKFLYENTSFPWALTGVIDEKDSRLSTFGYDSAGRAVSTELAGGVNRYSVSYETPPAVSITQTSDPATRITYRSHDWRAPAGVVLTTPNGQTTSLGTSTVLGTPVTTGVSQAAGSGCNASSSASTFDAVGNLTSQDDFEGQRTCYAYDSSNREVTRVEGLANTVACSAVVPVGSVLPSGARKVTTSWLGTWRLATQVVEPLLKTTTVYHGQPDPFNGNVVANCTTAAAVPNGAALPLVCKQVAQATLGNGSVDATVPARVNTFTYNSFGQLQTSTDPNGKTTTLAYYTDTSFDGAFDPHFDKVVLLLHGNGYGGQTSFTDDSSLRHSVARVDNPYIDAAQAKYGNASITFDGSNDRIFHPSTSSFLFGAGDFTVEAWVRMSALPATAGQIVGMHRYGIDKLWHLDVTSTGKVRWVNGGGVDVVGTTTLSSATWYHVAASRSGTTTRLFVNGVLDATSTDSFNYASYAQNLTIGADATGSLSAGFRGNIDDIRITSGVGRYTANFTPPAQEMPNSAASVASVGHTIGDLQSVTNAAGHVTQYDLYDALGRVRRMTDPKGVVTDTTYTPRGRVSALTVTAPGGNARTTTYSYDDAGQMTGAVYPDSTSLAYAYDAAHRLTGVTDARGNSVSYTLDNIGNRVGEVIKDPLGTPRRAIARSFDALNRLQQVTGAAALPKSQTTTTLQVSPSSAQILTPVTVTLTAQVAGNSPSGILTFYEGTTVLGTVTASNSTASMTYTFAADASKVMTASYSGDANNNLSSSAGQPLTVVDSRIATATTFACDDMPNSQTVVNIFVSCRVEVRPPTWGTVEIVEGTRALGTTSLSVYGGMSYSLGSIGFYNLTAGSHPFQARFVGNSTHKPSQSAPAAFTVLSKVTPVMSLACPVATQGTPFTCQVTLTTNHPGIFTGGPGTVYTGAPTINYSGAGSGAKLQGVVYLWDFGTQFSQSYYAITVSADRKSGVINVTFPGLSRGTHNLKATYSGNDSMLPATSPVLAHPVQ